MTVCTTRERSSRRDILAAEILNFAGAIHDPLLERITVLTALVDDLSTAEKSKRHDIAAQLKPLLHDTSFLVVYLPSVLLLRKPKCV